VAGHPRLALRFASANGRRGERVRLGGQDVTFVAPEDVPLDGVALVFSALPHGSSAPWVTRVSVHGAHVVDLSADLRPGNGAPVDVPYGLTEVARDELTGAAVVANPGCYPTAILLALLPLAEQGLVLPGGTIGVAAASGVTGAGSSPKPELLFGEVTENYRAYAVGNGHRHLAEMRATLARWGTDADVLFTPHLLPVARGILATLTVPLARPLEHPLELWRERFANEPFVEVTDELPSLRDVVHRNVVRIAVRAAENVRHPTLVVMAAIDNLVKGAAGQALQNANRVLGLDETAGLPR